MVFVPFVMSQKADFQHSLLEYDARMGFFLISVQLIKKITGMRKH